MSELKNKKTDEENEHVYITPYIKSLSLEQCHILLQSAIGVNVQDMYGSRPGFKSICNDHEAKLFCEKLLKKRGIINDLACLLKHCSPRESLIGLYYQIQQEGLWYYYNGYTNISDFDSVGQFMRCYNFLCLRKQGYLDETVEMKQGSLARYIFEKYWENDFEHDALDVEAEEKEWLLKKDGLYVDPCCDDDDNEDSSHKE